MPKPPLCNNDFRSRLVNDKKETWIIGDMLWFGNQAKFFRLRKHEKRTIVGQQNIKTYLHLLKIYESNNA